LTTSVPSASSARRTPRGTFVTTRRLRVSIHRRVVARGGDEPAIAGHVQVVDPAREGDGAAAPTWQATVVLPLRTTRTWGVRASVVPGRESQGFLREKATGASTSSGSSLGLPGSVAERGPPDSVQ
jgi:hypothetical protein